MTSLQEKANQIVGQFARESNINRHVEYVVQGEYVGVWEQDNTTFREWMKKRYCTNPTDFKDNTCLYHIRKTWYWMRRLDDIRAKEWLKQFYHKVYNK